MIKSVWKCINIIAISPKRGIEQAEIIDTFWTYQHSMCKKVERVMAKTGCTSCTKWIICFEISRFHTETCLLQQAFHMNYEKVESWHGIIIIVVESKSSLFLRLCPLLIAS